MSKCENCRLRKESAKAFDIHWHGEADCPYAHCPVPDFLKTNADRIRAMTDEELAEYLAPCACPPIRFNKNTGDIVCPVNKEPCESDCKSCWLDWLKKEAKE